MADYLIKGETLTGIADAIRSKTGSTDPIVVSDMANQIGDITGGGSGDGSAKFACGTLNPSKLWETITHNLGCVPDVFIITETGANADLSGAYLLAAYGFSEAARAKFGVTTGAKMYVANYPNSPYHKMASSSEGIDGLYSDVIDQATETTIRVCWAGCSLDSTRTYRWFAIGGIA